MKDFRNVALSSDALLIREGKRELGKIRYRHTTETLAVSRLTISVCVVTLLMKVFRSCTNVIYEDK